MPDLTPEAALAAIIEYGSIRKAAPQLGVPRSTLQDNIATWVAADPSLAERFNGAKVTAQRARPDAAQRPGVKIAGDEVVVTGDPLAEGLKTTDAEGYLRTRWGLPEGAYVLVSVTVNEWQGPVAGGGRTTFAQAKGTFRKLIDLEALLPRPAKHVPAILRPKRVRRAPDAPRLAIIEIDHQAPFLDPALDAAATAMHADLRPDEQVFAGDLMDFPTISRHPDHQAAMATVNACIDAGYGVLRRRREAAPDARARKIKGNHDVRPETELLLRAERMYGIRPAQRGPEPELGALSLRRLLHLDELGVELIEHPLGWEHAEVELVPGPLGLVVRHGWLTGASTAAKSLQRRGRSLIVGHTHTREHVFAWDPSAEVERQAAIGGAMCRVRGDASDERLRTAAGLRADVDELFPHFAVCDNWTQGLVTVTSWPSGAFLIEHARWINGALYWRDRAWRP